MNKIIGNARNAWIHNFPVRTRVGSHIQMRSDAFRPRITGAAEDGIGARSLDIGLVGAALPAPGANQVYQITTPQRDVLGPVTNVTPGPDGAA